MSVTVTPHLNFRGQARTALEHYRDAVDGQLVIVTFAELGAVGDPAEADQVMWGQVTGANGFAVMAFDVPSARPYDQGVDSSFVSVRGNDADEVTRIWEQLSQGGTVRQPLGPSAWAPLYGMVTDRFGVTWVLDVTAPSQG